MSGHKVFRLLSLLWLLCAALPLMAAPLAVAGNLRAAAVADGVVVRLALSQPLGTTPTAFALEDPLRLVVDLPHSSSLRRDIVGSGEVKAARVSQFDGDTVRLVIDLHRHMRIARARQGLDNVLELQLVPQEAPAFTTARRKGRVPLPDFVAEAARVVPPGPESPPDIADDSRRRLAEVERVLEEAARQAATPVPEEAQRIPQFRPPPVAVETPAPPAGYAPRPARRKDRFMVVLDAGHGGKDPGAPSVSGGKEKDVTLAIAIAARRAIERRAHAEGRRVEVRLTRGDDRFVTLGGRVRLARDWGADLFLSIHADSAANPDAHGATVYTLSDIASDREAARLAAKENRADIIAGVDLSGENREVAGLLVDLGMRDSMNASADFAVRLQKAMAKEGVPFRSNAHRFAGFQVLRNLGVPAVLLETGYMSNEGDSRRLYSSAGQRAIADGVADAVLATAPP